MTYEAVVSGDAAEALDTCREFLATDPIRHNVIWTLLRARAETGTSGRFAWVAERGAVVGVSLQSPAGLRATLTPMPTGAIVPLVSALRDAGAELPGATGQANATARFAGLWTEQAKVGGRPVGADRMYAITRVRPPEVARGSARPATSEDADTLVRWLESSHEETGEIGSDPDVMVMAAIAAGHYWVWDVDGPVSMAAVTPEVGGVTRIRGVYTPGDQRSNGYAAACVAKLSSNAVSRGVIPMLYTDLQNPVSNAVYRRIGYRAIDEVLHYQFS